MIENFKEIGFGQIQMIEETVKTIDGRNVYCVRGIISIANTDDIGIKGSKEEAKYLIRVSSSDGSISVVIKGCQVNILSFFDEELGASTVDVWVIDDD